MSDAMAAQVDAFSRKPLEPFKPWLRRDLPSGDEHRSRDGGIFSTIRQRVELLPSVRLPSQPSGHRQNMRSEGSEPSSSSLALVPDGNAAHATQVSEGPVRPQRSPSQNFGSGNALPVCPSTPSLRPRTGPLSANFPFATLQSEERPRATLKRRRSVTDIDGPNTAALCCKKRRLRRYLVTSRLSQPFSQPATHILNRESVASGDKRFLKLAAIINARRIVQLPLPQRAASLQSPSPSPSIASASFLSSPPAFPPLFPSPAAGSTLIPVPHPPNPGEMLRRLAMSNRFKKRVLAEAAASRKLAGLPRQQLTTSTFMASWPATPAPLQALLTTSSTAATFHMAAPRPAPSLLGTNPPLLTTAVRARLVEAATTDSPQAAPLASRLALSPSSSRPAMISPETLVQLSVDKTEKLQKPATQVAKSHNTVVDDADDAGDDVEDEAEDEDSDGYCAFPGDQNESRYEASDDPDPDDVYSDFSVLFQGPGEDSDFGEEGFDDYMDELDGIAHLPR
ncbi:hypothetical protein CMQ_3661 [Grosmannia clavigera kw1407]|uniref:Uncharacterized protein n=1 Tax=Grosmannia clavigera (strain kw1407 / UAMH 11150) TaxID=655863 RepID=F0X8N9_GROCL|nr:uncharacterized protein CMQ_3661 [Grosmannia clavigera kw1407]EFX05592.1 hypothetical protein CMQ_3661 [Grosmannia clavigera kw1407]